MLDPGTTIPVSDAPPLKRNVSVTNATNHIIIKLLFPSLDVETAGTTTVKRDNNRRQTFPSIGIPINNPPTVRTASIPKYNEKYFLNIGLFINKTVAKPKAKNITNIGMSPVKTSPMSICGFLNIQETKGSFLVHSSI